MNGRKALGLAFSVMVLLLLTGSGLAGVPPTQPREPVETSGTNASPGANAAWFVDEIDTDGDTGLHTSVVYHPSLGATFVSYYDATNQQLRMARSNGLGCGPNDEWGCHTFDPIDADVGKYSSVAVNPKEGGVGIAYHDATNGHLKYLYFENPHLLTHSIYTIDKGITDISKTGLHTSLAYSEEGTPFIAHYFENPSGVDALEFAYYTVTNGDCGYDFAENKWRCHTIKSGEGIGQYPSLVVRDNPVTNDWDFYISFYNGGTGDLWYGKSVEESANCGLYGSDMACYPVDASANDVGKYSSLYVDSAGDFHIAYYDATDHKLMYARELASGDGNCGVLGSAQCDEIDAMQADYHPVGISIAEDPAGYPAIAYQSANGSLKLARPLAALGLPAGSGNCGPGDLFSTWYCETIDPYVSELGGFKYRNGDYVSLAFSPSGLATIAYYRIYTNKNDGNLVVAYQRFQNHLPLVARNP